MNLEEEIEANELRLPQFRKEIKKFRIFVDQHTGSIYKQQNKEETLSPIQSNSVRQFKSDIKFYVNTWFMDVTENEKEVEQVQKSWRKVRKANFFYTVCKRNEVTLIYSHEMEVEFSDFREVHGPFESEMRAKVHYEDNYRADERRVIVRNIIKKELDFYCANNMTTMDEMEERRQAEQELDRQYSNR